MFYSKKLYKLKKVKHCFFSRKKGFSKGIYKSLNCGKGSKDSKKNIRKNLHYVKQKILSKENDISLLHQIHSSKYFFIKKFNKKKIFADALITNVRNLPIAILTADCVPILILDRRKKVIAAIHAGWRGAFREIAIKVLKKLIRLGSNKKDIIAVIGPSIGQNNYEIGKEFRDKFIKKSKKNSRFFKFSQKRIYFDLGKFIYFQLNSFGISKIDVIRKDTFDKKNNFFSARRSLKNNETDYGRNISVIMLK